LNIIDALREAKKYDDANLWVDKTSQRFSGLPTATNALNARLRMEVFRENWQKAIEAADALRVLRNFSSSMTSLDEVNYLKAFALEKSGRKAEAIAVYSAIPNTLTSYYGGLASDKLNKLSGNSSKIMRAVSVSSSLTGAYPVMYRTELPSLCQVTKHRPAFCAGDYETGKQFPRRRQIAFSRSRLLSSFLIRHEIQQTGWISNLQAENLYQPSVNIAIGSVYISELKNQFGGLYEAIAASYTAAKTMRKMACETKSKDAEFRSEVGFAESKNYVFKVMNNYVFIVTLHEELRRKYVNSIYIFISMFHYPLFIFR
jgi:hypothetical protein